MNVPEPVQKLYARLSCIPPDFAGAQDCQHTGIEPVACTDGVDAAAGMRFQPDALLPVCLNITPVRWSGSNFTPVQSTPSARIWLRMYWPNSSAPRRLIHSACTPSFAAPTAVLLSAPAVRMPLMAQHRVMLIATRQPD